MKSTTLPVITAAPAFYRGILVIRTNGNRSGSFGIICLTKETNNRPDAEDVVRHEYGHTKQLHLLGPLNYLLCIGLPSFFEWGSDPSYYERPWEITADIFGGVTSRVHPSLKVQEGMEYLGLSALFGAFV